MKSSLVRCTLLTSLWPLVTPHRHFAHHMSYLQVKSLVDHKLLSAASNNTAADSSTPPPPSSTVPSQHIHNTTLLIDVRTPEETLRYGMIPSAINIPVNILQEVLGDDVSQEEFAETYGIEKPKPESHQLVFYCQHGVRSATATEMAELMGFRSVANYGGSFAEWNNMQQQGR